MYSLLALPMWLSSVWLAFGAAASFLAITKRYKFYIPSKWANRYGLPLAPIPAYLLVLIGVVVPLAILLLIASH